ncbi:MAG: energy transducer TonB [Acidobacteria bacterium]|nr:energy transducer TonB [Acidobacteriota bacterium]
MAEEVNRSALFAADDHSLAVDLAWEAEEDKRTYKIALLIALVFHIILIWVTIPDFGNKNFVEEKKNEKIMRRVILRPPPEQQMKQLKLQKKMQKIPVPDPTPDKPEPIVPITTNDQTQLNINDNDYIIGVPDAPPAPTGPIRDGTLGLTRPVYDLAQLQSNVVYPELGKKAGMQGYVLLEVVLKKDGKVGRIRVLGGSLRALGFPEAAIRAVKKMKFTPGKLRGQPVDVVLTLTVNFRLRR